MPDTHIEAPPNTEWNFYSLQAARDWVNRATLRQLVAAIEHNSTCARLALLADSFADPVLIAGRSGEVEADPYARATYYGPVVAGHERNWPVMGFLAEPADAERRIFWRATVQYARRLSAFEVTSDPVPSSTAAAQGMIGICGPFAEALIPLRGSGLPAVMVREDPGSVGAATDVMNGLRLAALRFVVAARSGQAQAVDVNETRVRGLIDSLATEYDTETRRNTERGVGGMLAATAGSFLARGQMKPRGLYQFRR